MPQCLVIVDWRDVLHLRTTKKDHKYVVTKLHV